MELLSDYVRVYDDALDTEFCKKLVSFFEANKVFHDPVDHGGLPTFTQYNLTESLGASHPFSKELASACKEHTQKYAEDLRIKFLPKKHSWEMFRIKKYVPGGKERFDEHVDVADYKSAKRYLAFFIYLNDVDEGGETLFSGYNGDMNHVKPKSGRMVVFPPLWMFPHSGLPPVSGDKYIVSGYFHYL
jgi:prolyl 4-hydroxylase|tara:strand:+ start:341 stop:904 length:564 start_codon:yes stop_codon:yes gene_type:complete